MSYTEEIRKKLISIRDKAIQERKNSEEESSIERFRIHVGISCRFLHPIQDDYFSNDYIFSVYPEFIEIKDESFILSNFRLSFNCEGTLAEINMTDVKVEISYKNIIEIYIKNLK